MQTDNSKSIRYSILDLASVRKGSTPADSFKNSLALARAADQLGYTRYWFAEHHNMPGVASSAPSILIGFIAAQTSNLRVGSGGIMLPNHAPLIVAEQFGTLESLFPGRIDLGLGRAPGTDQLTAMAIRRQQLQTEHQFPQEVQHLQQLFSASNHLSKVRAIPGEGLDIPIWILGSSLDSARVAATLGLPYAFASHFAPTYFLEAIDLYRRLFQPSDQCAAPYVMACVNVVAADTDSEAKFLATSVRRLFRGIISGNREMLQLPADEEDNWSEAERMAVDQFLHYSFIGSKGTIEKRLNDFIKRTGIQEIMATSHIYDPAARIDSYRLFAGAMQQVNSMLASQPV